MTTIVVFASSLFIALTLLILKSIQLKSGKQNAILGLLSRIDVQTVRFLLILKSKTFQFLQSVHLIIFFEIKNIFWYFWNKLQKKIETEYNNRKNIIMGHKNISNKGSVSFYLKKINESKRNGNRGEIN